MKDIKDYLPHYVGSKVLTTHLALNNGEPQELTVSITNIHDILYRYKDSKLILRRLSTMTQDESKKAHDIYYTDKIQLLAIMDVAHFELCRYLLSKGFDLFGLIDSGLAIEQTKLTTP